MMSSRAGLWGVTVPLLAVGLVAGTVRAWADMPESTAPAGVPAGAEAEFIPAFAQPNGAVTERQLADLGARLSHQLGSQSAHPVAVEHPFAPVNRLRALVALVKLGLVGDGPLPAAAGSGKLPPDAGTIPAWGTPYVAAAVEQGWWPGDRPLQAGENATWAFVRVVLARVLDGSPAAASPAAPSPAGGSSAAPAADANPAYTGLVLDARGLDLQRTMGPRIVDEDGQLLYPDPKNVPDVGFLEDHGMVAYVKDGQETPRSGSHPLIVPTLAVNGPAHENLVVSRETARQIREADARGGFLAHWAVSILIGGR